MMIDEKKIEKQEKSSVKLTVTVKAEETTKAYDSLMTKYGKQAQIPGFRAGKVPRSVMERKFGEGIRQEAAANLIDDALKAALEGEEAQPLGYGYPELEGVPELNPGENFTFTVTYDVFPEIKMGNHKGLEIEEAQVKILKKHETAELETIRERNSVVVDKADKTVVDGTVVTMDYVELGDDDKALEESRRKGFVFTMGKDDHPYAIEDDLKGLKVDETKIVEKTFPEDYQPNAYLAGRSVKLEVKIEAVKERQLPDLDDELAQDVSEDLKTLDDLKQKVKADLKERADSKIRAKSIQAINESLLKGAEIDLPESMVRADLESTWRDYVRQSQVAEEVLVKALEEDGRSKESIQGEWREDAEKSIRTRLILGKIVEDEKIEASDEDVQAELEKRAEDFKMGAEELEKMFGGPQFREYLKNELVQTKLYDFLLENASVKKGEKIDYNDLMDA